MTVGTIFATLFWLALFLLFGLDTMLVVIIGGAALLVALVAFDRSGPDVTEELEEVEEEADDFDLASGWALNFHDHRRDGSIR